MTRASFHARMATLPCLALLSLPWLLAAESEKPVTHRYVRLERGKFVPESDVRQTRTEDGTTYVSRTDRGAEKMTLTIRRDKDGKLVGAEALLETPKAKQRVQALPQKDRFQLKRAGGVTEFVKVAGDPVVTTAPDWSDVFQLVRRYNRDKGARQQFPGLWIHPTLPNQVLTFTVERQGQDTVRSGDKDVGLDRYLIRLRSSDYVVWADRSGRVYKLMPPKRPDVAVVLEGQEEAVKQLGH